MTEPLISGGLLIITATDFDASFRFYTQTLGLTEKYRAGNDWAEIQAGGLSIGLHGPKGQPAAEGSASDLSLNFEVADIHAAVKELESRGVVFTQGVVDDAAVLLAHFHDPGGNPLSLYQERKRE